MVNSRPYRIIISGGGTGGHVYPAIAIGKALRATMAETDILFVGALGKMEMEKVPAAGFTIKGLWISGFQRGAKLNNLLFPLKVLISLVKAYGIIRKFKPDVVVGVGGYASWPVVWVGKSKGIPALLQEQNSFAGLSNRLLAKKADKICVAHEGMEKFFPAERIKFTGNPVREDLVTLYSGGNEDFSIASKNWFDLDPQKKTLLVLGGSLGARTINESLIGGIEKFLHHEIQVIWQCGRFYYLNFQSQLSAFGDLPEIKLYEFLNDMDKAYAASDVVISRAGALAVSELCLVGKPTIFVPSPNVAEDHQRKNAEAFYKRNAAVLIEDHEAREKLVDTAIDLLQDEGKQQELSQNIRKWARPDAASDIAREILELIKPEDS